MKMKTVNIVRVGARIVLLLQRSPSQASKEEKILMYGVWEVVELQRQEEPTSMGTRWRQREKEEREPTNTGKKGNSK